MNKIVNFAILALLSVSQAGKISESVQTTEKLEEATGLET